LLSYGPSEHSGDNVIPVPPALLYGKSDTKDVASNGGYVWTILTIDEAMTRSKATPPSTSIFSNKLVQFSIGGVGVVIIICIVVAIIMKSNQQEESTQDDTETEKVSSGRMKRIKRKQVENAD